MGKSHSGITKFSWLFSQAINKYALMTSECCSIKQYKKQNRGTKLPRSHISWLDY